MAFINKRTGRTFGQDMEDALRKFVVLASDRFPDHVVTEAQKLVDESFRAEQYQDGKSTKWAPRKADPEAGLARTERRALLVQSGRLIGSVEATRRGGDVVIGTDVEYAQVHNEGGNAGKNRSARIPQRQFMPIPGQRVEKLDRAVETWLNSEMDKIFD